MKLLHKIEIDPIQLVRNLIESYSFPFLLEVLIDEAKSCAKAYQEFEDVESVKNWKRVANDLKRLNIDYKKMSGVNWNYSPKTKELINEE